VGQGRPPETWAAVTYLDGQVTGTRRNIGDRGDVRRSAHNPEVEGSNPSPATKARGPFSKRERASCARFVNVVLVHPVSRTSLANRLNDLERGQRPAYNQLRERVGHLAADFRVGLNALLDDDGSSARTC